MEIIFILVCITYIITSYYAKHVFKSKCVSYSNKFGFALGSIFGALTDGIAWYWLFKLTRL